MGFLGSVFRRDFLVVTRKRKTKNNVGPGRIYTRDYSRGSLNGLPRDDSLVPFGYFERKEAFRILIKSMYP
jgi:hypothetical protein